MGDWAEEAFGLKVGDTVEWTSQAGGNSRTKRGVVVAVVAAGARPNRSKFPALHRWGGCGLPRSHQSYVVKVDGRGVYWPRSSALRRVEDALT